MAPRTTRVLLLRHGQSTWNAMGRWQGQADPPLSPLGEAQARAAAEVLEPFDAVVASDLRRARRTAEIIAEASGGGPVEIEEGLREADVGPWSGLTRDEIEQRWPGWLAAGRRPPEAERPAEIAARVVAALEHVHAAHPGASVLAVTHSGVVRYLEGHLGDRTEIPRNLGGRWFDVAGRTVVGGALVAPVDLGFDRLNPAPDAL
jgi:probable phosphoglycerate mutase